MTGNKVVLLAGNPNAGKTTLFNALTGSQARVGNYPGVTVERRCGQLRVGTAMVDLVDLPGTYSLTARSAEEDVAIGAVFGRGADEPAAIIVVVDSTSLRRGLYFALQVVETGVPTVLALSLADEAEGLGIALNTEALAMLSGVPVVAVAAAKKRGLDALREAVGAQLERPASVPAPALVLPDMLREALDALAAHLAEVDVLDARKAQALARYALLACDDAADADALVGVSPAAAKHACEVRGALEAAGVEPDVAIVGARYAIVDAWAKATIGDVRPRRTRTEALDRWLTHPIAGLLTFLIVMGVVFEALYTWSAPFVSLIESTISLLQRGLGLILPHGPLRDLLADGVIGGVGNVVAFVPQIALLFLFITILEDSGYLARVAFVIDRVMKGVGLHGKAFVPLLSGFACAIPAVLATRTIENRRDRLVTMLALPLMSCSARLPVYVLVVATVFPHGRVFHGLVSPGAVALLGLYSLSIIATLAAAALMRRTVLQGPRPTLLLELPPYRAPIVRNVLRAVSDRVKSFLTEAGTTILALSIVLWALLNYPQDSRLEAHYSGELARLEQLADTPAREAALSALSSEAAESRLEHSALGRVGKVIEPVLAPLGFDWRIDVGILGAFAAREVFISTLGIVFGLGGGDETSAPLLESLRHATRADGTLLFDTPTGVSLMIFFVLACQCMSTLAVVRREAGGWKWAAFLFGYMTVLAYAGAYVAYVVTSAVVGG